MPAERRSAALLWRAGRFCSSRSRSMPFRPRAVSVSARSRSVLFRLRTVFVSARSRSVLFRLRGIFVRAAACSAVCVPFGCPESLERRPIKYIFLIFSVVSPTLLSPCSAVRNPDAAACTRPRNMPFRCREQQYRRHDHIRLPGRSSHRVRRCSRFGDTVASSCLRSYPPPPPAVIVQARTLPAPRKQLFYYRIKFVSSFSASRPAVLSRPMAFSRLPVLFQFAVLSRPAALFRLAAHSRPAVLSRPMALSLLPVLFQFAVLFRPAALSRPRRIFRLRTAVLSAGFPLGPRPYF